MSDLQNEIQIESFSNLTSGSDARFVQEFSQLPHKVRQAPFHKGLLPEQVWERFLKMPLPFKRDFWLAKNLKGEVVGRIGANLSATRALEGNLGFFEVDLSRPEHKEIAKSLLNNAISWLRSEGVEDIYGPINFNTWFPYRFQATASDGKSPMFAWEPINPPQYAELWQENGFKEIERYKSQGFANLETLIDVTRADYDKACEKGISFRPFDEAHIFDREVPILHALSMEGFRSAFLFEPIDLESFKQLYVPIANKKMDLAAYFALDASGKEVGFFFCFIDQDYLVLKTVTVADRARGLGISNALTHMSAKRALQLGCDKFITALVRSGAQSESFTKKAPELWKHEYVLLSAR